MISRAGSADRTRASRRRPAIPRRITRRSAGRWNISIAIRRSSSTPSPPSAGLSFRWAEQQPEAFQRTYRQEGHPRRLRVAWARNDPLAQPAAARARQERGVRRHPRADHRRIQPIANGSCRWKASKTGRELPAIVDQIITYQFLNFGDDKPPIRGFVCTAPNAWSYPAKDRSGRLDQIEQPDLGKLLSKLTRPSNQTERRRHNDDESEQLRLQRCRRAALAST